MNRPENTTFSRQFPQNSGTAVSSSSPHVLIVGSGIAGLSAAIHFSDFARVTVLAKATLDEGNTRYAQGGIAAVVDPSDRFDHHIEDTWIAGAKLGVPEVIHFCVQEGPARIEELKAWGANFEQELHREGGHGARRILHTHDSTGQTIENALIQKIRSLSQIDIREHHTAIDLIMENKVRAQSAKKPFGRALGVYALNTKAGTIAAVQADLVVLATGGAGKVYLYTSNPDVATGDGVAMAHRAGATVANLEFMQFHPTCLYHPSAKNFLITEALRGEGAKLLTFDGRDLMEGKHPLGSLAPRDIVARAIDAEMKRTASPHVWLDARHLSTETFKEKFPEIARFCGTLGIHAPKDLIPVVPAAHYSCGGVWTDHHGATTVHGLYAIGEVACTGLHGANRLASNSLLEALVFAKRCADHAKNTLKNSERLTIEDRLPEWDFGRAVELEEQIDITAAWREIRTLMWNYVGIVRTDRRLNRARERLALIRHELNEDYWKFRLNRDLIELRNLLTVSELIVECALRRSSSIGLHYNTDRLEPPLGHPPETFTLV